MIRVTRTLTTPLAIVSLAEAKSWLMVDTAVTEDDALIQALIDQVHSMVEEYLNTTFGTYDYKLEFWDKSEIRLVKLPLLGTVTLTSITDSDGDTIDYDDNEYYYTFTTTLDGVINYTIAATSVPNGLKLAILNIIKEFYNDREKIGLSQDDVSILNQYRQKIWI
jgi:hypothetical protein